MNRIKALRKEKKITQKELAELLFVEQSAISQWENDHTFPTAEMQKKLAEIFDVSIDYLLGRSDIKKEDNTYNAFTNVIPFSKIIKKRVQVLGDIACGEPIYAQEQYGDFIDCGVDADFALTCKGDSMQDARINDGDLVFIKKQDVVENGAIAAVIIDNEATLKRVFYYPETEKLVLQAANPKYEPFVYIGAELENVRILGKAVAFQSLL